jgi:hypothetical protein
MRRGSIERVPDEFCQVLLRGYRDCPPNGRWQWRCPEAEGGCGRWVNKLFLPMRTWTMAMTLGVEEPRREELIAAKGFLCWKCAGLVYESTAASRKRGHHDAVAWDQFIRRMSGGVLSGEEVAPPKGFGAEGW